MKAEIISVGTELLFGEILDTDTQYLASQLGLMGIDLYFTSSVGDNHERLLEVLKQAWHRSELIITTGGLGPTQDDITREAVACLLGEELSVDPVLKQEIVSFFARLGVGMPTSNIKQASIIPSATSLTNPHGTAPGWWIEKDGRILVTMPGPPGEMQSMWQNRVFPRLQERTGAVILTRMIKTIGLSEAAVDEVVAHLLSSPNPSLATYAKQDGIYLRIAAKAPDLEEAQAMVSRREADVRMLLGDYIWGVDEDTHEAVLGQLLIAGGLSLAVAESFTGGFLTNTIASDPRSRSYFKGGLVANTNEAKIALGIDPALSAGDRAAAAMASLARRKLDASIGIGIDGYTESDGNTVTEKIFIAIDSEKTRQNAAHSYSVRLPQMRRRAVYQALFDLKKLLSSDG